MVPELNNRLYPVPGTPVRGGRDSDPPTPGHFGFSLRTSTSSFVPSSFRDPSPLAPTPPEGPSGPSTTQYSDVEGNTGPQAYPEPIGLDPSFPMGSRGTSRSFRVSSLFQSSSGRSPHLPSSWYPVLDCRSLRGRRAFPPRHIWYPRVVPPGTC